MRYSISKFQFIKSIWPDLATRYDQAAQNWHSAICKLGYINAYRELVSHFLSSTQFQQNQLQLDILDAGTGSGGFSLALAEKLHEPQSIDLLDISQKMLDRASNTLSHLPHRIDYICANIQKFETAKKQYDIILCAHVIEHLNDPVSSLHSIGQALKPGGVLLLVVSKPHWCTALVQLKWHHKAYKPHQVSQILQNAGMDQVHPFAFSAGPPKFTSYAYIVQSPDQR